MDEESSQSKVEVDNKLRRNKAQTNLNPHSSSKRKTESLKDENNDNDENRSRYSIEVKEVDDRKSNNINQSGTGSVIENNILIQTDSNEDLKFDYATERLVTEGNEEPSENDEGIEENRPLKKEPTYNNINGQDHIKDSELEVEFIHEENEYQKESEKEESIVINSNSVPRISSGQQSSRVDLKERKKLSQEFEEEWRRVEQASVEHIQANTEIIETYNNEDIEMDQGINKFNKKIKELAEYLNSFSLTTSNDEEEAYTFKRTKNNAGGSNKVANKQVIKQTYTKETDNFENYVITQQRKLNDFLNRDSLPKQNKAKVIDNIYAKPNEKIHFSDEEELKTIPRETKVSIITGSSLDFEYKPKEEKRVGINSITNIKIHSVNNRNKVINSMNLQKEKSKEKFSFLKNQSVIAGGNKMDYFYEKSNVIDKDHDDYNIIMDSYINNIKNSKKEIDDKINDEMSKYLKTKVKDTAIKEDIETFTHGVKKYKNRLKACEEKLTSQLKSQKVYRSKLQALADSSIKKTNIFTDFS